MSCYNANYGDSTPLSGHTSGVIHPCVTPPPGDRKREVGGAEKNDTLFTGPPPIPSRTGYDTEGGGGGHNYSNVKWMGNLIRTVCVFKKLISFVNGTFCPLFRTSKKNCVGRESNPGQLLKRQFCSPLYHRRFILKVSILTKFVYDNLPCKMHSTLFPVPIQKNRCKY